MSAPRWDWSVGGGLESPCELLARALGIAQYVLSQQCASDDDSFIVGCLLWMKECAGVSQGQRRASLVVWTVEVGALQGLLAKLKIRYGKSRRLVVSAIT